MFRQLGSIITRAWPLWLALWAGLLAAGWALSPDWGAVADGGTFRFLPDEVPSRRAEELLRRAFSGGQADSSIVIVARRADAPLGREDERFITDRLVPDLRRIAEDPGAFGPDPGGSASSLGAEPPPEVVRIRSLANDVERPVLVSDDGRATLIQVELDSGYMDRANRLVVEPVRGLVDRLRRQGVPPDGLELAVTGSAVVGRDLNEREAASARVIERWTIWWVLLLLLVVHRAPLLAIAQMATVFVAMRVALDLMALMARRGWIGLFEGLDVYTTVLVYGAGIDYSLFLISRYRERLEAGDPPGEAMASAIRRVGLAVAISAGTAIVAVGTLRSARFGMFERAGFTIPFGLLVMLAASLTLTPALLLMLRGLAIWPSRPGPSAEGGRADGGGSRLGRLSRGDPLGGIWRWIGGGLRRRPGLIWSASLLLMIPPAVFGVIRRDDVSYAPMSEIPGDAPSIAAVDLLRQHFPAGIAGPLTVVLRDDSADFSSEEGIDRVDRLTDRLLERREELGIAGLRSVAEGFGSSRTPDRDDDDPGEGPEGGLLGDTLGAIGGAVEALVPGDTSSQARRALRDRAVEEYVGRVDGEPTVTRIVVVPEGDPFSSAALDRVSTTRGAVADSLPEGLSDAEVLVSGPSASLSDLRAVTRGDRGRIYVLATLGVALVLVALLRRVAVSLYLLGTVLLGYLVTIGVTVLVFRAIEGPSFDGIDWTVPVFLFTLLMAIGADYNVFLLSRIDEERQDRGAVEGVVAGLSRTGGIISGCGVIMAGTFSSLIWGGTLSSLDQLGFALAFGVLLDTFFVRPLLVPSYLVLIDSGRLGPLGRLLGGRPDQPAEGESE